MFHRCTDQKQSLNGCHMWATGTYQGPFLWGCVKIVSSCNVGREKMDWEAGKSGRINTEPPHKRLCIVKWTGSMCSWLRRQSLKQWRHVTMAENVLNLMRKLCWENLPEFKILFSYIILSHLPYFWKKVTSYNNNYKNIIYPIQGIWRKLCLKEHLYN